MRSAIDVVKGTINGIDERTGVVTVLVRYDDWPTLIRRGYKECLVEMVDSRTLSDRQRRTCYALIGAIAEYVGESKASIKEWTKLKFLADEMESDLDHLFSLSSAPMSLICAYERYLVRFILEHDIPTKFSLLQFADDVADYVYACLINKKCAVCGKPAELHHVDRVGMGRDRREIEHLGLRAQPLCREHHREVDDLGQREFNEKYHLCEGIEIDRTIARIYRLKTKEGKKQ